MKKIILILSSLISTISFVNAQCSEDDIKREAWDIISTDSGSFSKSKDEVDYKQGWEKAWSENNSINQYSLKIMTKSTIKEEEEIQILKVLLNHYSYKFSDNQIFVRVEYIAEDVLSVIQFIAYQPSTTSNYCGLIGVTDAIVKEIKD